MGQAQVIYRQQNDSPSAFERGMGSVASLQALFAPLLKQQEDKKRMENERLMKDEDFQRQLKLQAAMGNLGGLKTGQITPATANRPASIGAIPVETQVIEKGGFGPQGHYTTREIAPTDAEANANYIPVAPGTLIDPAQNQAFQRGKKDLDLADTIKALRAKGMLENELAGNKPTVFNEGDMVATPNQVKSGEAVIPKKGMTPIQLKFNDVGDAIVGQHPSTGEEISRTPKTPGKETKVTPQGLYVFDPKDPTNGTIAPGTAPTQAPSGLYNDDQRAAVMQLTDRFQKSPYVQKATSAQGSLDIIRKGIEQNNSAGDIAAVNQFQSGMVDPGATVREGDIALIQKSASLMARVQNYLPRLVKGGMLPPELRKEIRDMSEEIYEMRAANANEEVGRMKQLVPKFGIQFEDIGKEFPTKVSGQVKSYTSEDEIRQAKVPDGTKIIMNGKPGTWYN